MLGYAGIITLGHAMFFGLGAYAAGLISKAGWGEPLTGLLLAGAFAGLVGFVASFIIVRVQHLALIMITLGLGLLTYELANSMTWLTGGTDGLQGVDTWPIFGVFGFDLWGYTAYAYALAVLFLGVARQPPDRPFLLRPVAARHPRERRAACRRSAPTTAATCRRSTRSRPRMAGVAGALLTQTTDTVSLDTLSFQRSADVVVMLILGGTGRLYGGIVGAIIFLLARDQLSDMNPQYWYFWIGLLLMVVVLVMPNGILGGLSRLAGMRRLMAGRPSPSCAPRRCKSASARCRWRATSRSRCRAARAMR